VAPITNMSHYKNTSKTYIPTPSQTHDSRCWQECESFSRRPYSRVSSEDTIQAGISDANTLSAAPGWSRLLGWARFEHRQGFGRDCRNHEQHQSEATSQRPIRVNVSTPRPEINSTNRAAKAVNSTAVAQGAACCVHTYTSRIQKQRRKIILQLFCKSM